MPPASTTRTILIIEDMPVLREPIASLLEHEGYRTLSAGTGAEAWTLVRERTPDLVLLDLLLPDLDGLTLLSRMRRTPRLRTVPVIVLSVAADRDRIIQAARLGVTRYLLKTHFSLRTLLEAIRATLESPQTPDFRAGGVPSQPVRTRPTDASPEPADTPARGTATPQSQASPAGDHTTGPGTFSDPVAALRSLSPLISRDDLLRRIEDCGQLKALAPTVSQVLKLASHPRVSIDALARAIALDQAIALKILKLANSAAYARGEPVDSVHRAVARIGMERIRQAVLNINVLDQFSTTVLGGLERTLQFWEHAIATGLIAAELVRTRDDKHTDTAFTMGLLHDVGRIIFAQQLGETYQEVIRTAERLGLPLELVESRLLGLNHADAMERTLHAWSFARELTAPIVHHHLSPANARSLSPRQPDDVVRLGLADRLAHALLLGHSGNDTIYPIDEHCRALNLSEAIVRQIEETAQAQTDEIKYTLLAASEGKPWARHHEQVRAQIAGPFRPLFVGPTPDMDAYRIFCQRLCDPDPNQPPNVAVVHIPSPRERTAMSDRLLAAETQAGVSTLPAIVLSPAARLGLEGPAAQRPTALLPSPTVVARFTAAVNALLRVDSRPAA